MILIFRTRVRKVLEALKALKASQELTESLENVVTSGLQVFQALKGLQV